MGRIMVMNFLCPCMINIMLVKKHEHNSFLFCSSGIFWAEYCLFNCLENVILSLPVRVLNTSLWKLLIYFNILFQYFLQRAGGDPLLGTSTQHIHLPVRRIIVGGMRRIDYTSHNVKNYLARSEDKPIQMSLVKSN